MLYLIVYNYIMLMKVENGTIQKIQKFEKYWIVENYIFLNFLNHESLEIVISRHKAA